MPKYNKQKRFCIKSHGPSFTLLAYWAPMTSNLPLDLKSITYVSDPHQTPMTLKDKMRQWLYQWIYNVIFGWNSFHYYISSGYDLFDMLEPPQNTSDETQVPLFE